MPEIRFEADTETANIINGYCAVTGKSRTEFINSLLKQWEAQKLHDGYGGISAAELRAIRAFASLCAAVQEAAVPDRKALARTADDVARELRGLSSALQKAGLRQHWAAADVAAWMIETIVEELRDGG